MTEDLRHLGESGPPTNHPGGRCVAKDMSARARNNYTGELQRPTGNASNACVAQGTKRSVAMQEYRPVWIGRTRFPQIFRESQTDFGGQRELALTA